MKKIFVLFALTAAAVSLFAQTFSYSFTNVQTYQMTVRANYRVYINDKYSGLVSHEYKSLLDVKSVDDGVFGVTGTSYCLSQLIFGGKIVGFRVDDVVKTDFWVYADGAMSVLGDNIPYMRNVPVFKHGTLGQDEVYAGIGSYVPTIEINGSTHRFVLPATVSMQYNGEAQIFGKKCDMFYSTLTLNAQNNYKELKSAGGKHNLRVYFDNALGMPVYIEDNFSDYFVVNNDGGTVTNIRQDGFYLYFYEPYRRLRVHLAADSVRDILEEDPDAAKHITVREDDDGLSLVLHNLHFGADSASIMPDDYKVIYTLAKILNKNKDKMILITGHTADAGTPEEQKSLSFERAKAVAEALIDQKVQSKQLMIDGKGASEPAAPNDTPANMAKNRRVEIKILGR